MDLSEANFPPFFVFAGPAYIKTDYLIVLFGQFLNISRAFSTNYQTSKLSRKRLWSDTARFLFFNNVA